MHLRCKCRCVGVGHEAGAVEALALRPTGVQLAGALARGLDARLDGRRRLAQAFVGEFFVFDAGDLNMDVDPTGRLRTAVQEGAGDSLLVAADDPEAAGALFDRIPEVTTGAGI